MVITQRQFNDALEQINAEFSRLRDRLEMLEHSAKEKEKPTSEQKAAPKRSKNPT